MTFETATISEGWPTVSYPSGHMPASHAQGCPQHMPSQLPHQWQGAAAAPSLHSNTHRKNAYSHAQQQQGYQHTLQHQLAQRQQQQQLNQLIKQVNQLKHLQLQQIQKAVMQQQQHLRQHQHLPQQQHPRKHQQSDQQQQHQQQHKQQHHQLQQSNDGSVCPQLPKTPPRTRPGVNGADSIADSFSCKREHWGLLFGKKGSNLSSVRKCCEVEVVLNKRKALVSIYGKTKASVQEARRRLEIIQLAVPFPRPLVVQLVGRGFGHLREIERHSGVSRIFVDCDHLGELLQDADTHTSSVGSSVAGTPFHLSPDTSPSINSRSLGRDTCVDEARAQERIDVVIIGRHYEVEKAQALLHSRAGVIKFEARVSDFLAIPITPTPVLAPAVEAPVGMARPRQGPCPGLEQSQWDAAILAPPAALEAGSYPQLPALSSVVSSASASASASTSASASASASVSPRNSPVRPHSDWASPAVTLSSSPSYSTDGLSLSPCSLSPQGEFAVPVHNLPPPLIQTHVASTSFGSIGGFKGFESSGWPATSSLFSAIGPANLAATPATTSADGAAQGYSSMFSMPLIAAPERRGLLA